MSEIAKRIFASFDRYGVPAVLKVKSQRKYKTFCGFFITIGFFLALIGYAASSLSKFFITKRPKAINSKTVFGGRIFREDFTTFTKPMFWFRTQATGAKSQPLPLNQINSFLSVSAYYLNQFQGDDYHSFNQSYAFAECTSTQQDQFKDYYITPNDQTPVCLKAGNKTIIPRKNVTYNENQFHINIKYCKSTDPYDIGNGCSLDYVTSNEIWIGVLIPKVKLNAYSFSHPYMYTYENFIIKILKKPNYYYHFNIPLKKMTVVNDRGLSFLNGSPISFFDSLELQTSEYSIGATKWNELQSHFQLIFRATFQEELITRAYNSFTEILSKIGAKSRTFLLCFSLVYLIYNRKGLQNHLKKCFYITEDPGLPKEISVKGLLSKLKAKGKKITDKDMGGLSKKEQTDLYVVKAIEEMFVERVDILKKMRRKAITKSILGAMLSEAERREIPYNHILEGLNHPQMSADIPALSRYQGLGFREAVAALNEKQDGGDGGDKEGFDSLIDEYLRTHLPKSILALKEKSKEEEKEEEGIKGKAGGEEDWNGDDDDEVVTDGDEVDGEEEENISDAEG